MSAVGYTSKILQLTSPSLGASVTAAQVAAPFKISHEDSFHTTIQIKASAASGTVTAFLQSSADGGNHWHPAGSVVISGTDYTFLDYHYEEEDHAPLLPLARVVITTGGGSSVTLESINVTRRK